MNTLFTRRDRLVAAFHASAGDRKRSDRLFNLILAINRRLLDRGNKSLFRHSLRTA